MKTLSKFIPLNFIGDIWEPKYSSRTVIIADNKIKRSKLDIKLRFSGVSETSEYAGNWYLPRNKALKYKSFINNGLMCREIPWHVFTKLQLTDREDY